MRTFGISMAVMFVVGVVGVAIGAEVAGGGRVLPGAVKQAVWAETCDVPDHDYDVDCTTNTDATKCTWQRADGTKFQPTDGGVYLVHKAGRSFGYDSMKAAREGLDLGAMPDRIDDEETAFLFRAVSGIGLTAKKMSFPLQLNPAAIDWVERELVPEPSQPMCGHTAQELYDVSFKSSARAFALTLAELAQGGHLKKKVPMAQLGRTYDQGKGASWNTCMAISEKHQDQIPQGLTIRTCYFWLRRASTGALPELAAFTTRFVQKYDASFYKEHEAAFAKLPVVKPVN